MPELLKNTTLSAAPDARYKVCFRSLGCRLNEAETERWASDFSQHGYATTRDPGHADLIVVNTCAVTVEATRKSRQLIRRMQRDNPAAKLVVSGCFATLEPATAAAIAGVDLLIDNRDKDQLVDLVVDKLDLKVMPDHATVPGEQSLFARNRNRGFIKIQDGCRHRCTYCIVTTARGDERSQSPESIAERINSLHQSGIKEAVLTGVHIGGYGHDINSDLTRLIRFILRETDIPRLRLGSVEPWDLTPDFFTLFDDPRLMPHLHLPLQSGCDSVLKRMARRCKTGDFADLVHSARANIPDFNVTTDIIVGFPGETNTEWVKGLAFIETMAFSHIHIFSYSPRTGTAAVRLPNVVDDASKRQRSRELHTLAQRMKVAALESKIGATMKVLWEGADTDKLANSGIIAGYASNYMRVIADPAQPKPGGNRLETVAMTGLSDDGHCLIGRPV